jgi:hypothetical protein
MSNEERMSDATRETAIRLTDDQPRHCRSSTGRADDATDIEPTMSIAGLSSPLMLQLGFGLLLAKVISALAVPDLNPMILPDRLTSMLGSIGFSQDVVPGLPRPLDSLLDSFIAAFRRLRGVHGSHPGLSQRDRTLAAWQLMVTT